MNKVLVGAISAAVVTTALVMAKLAEHKPNLNDAHPICTKYQEERVGANVHQRCIKHVFISGEEHG